MPLGGKNSDAMFKASTTLDILHVTADATLTPVDRVVEAVPNGTGDVTVTLPPCEVVGDMLFHIRSNGSAANNIVVADALTNALATLTADNDEVTLWSTGHLWVILTQTIAGVRS